MAVFHASPVRWFPQGVFTQAMQLDAIRYTDSGAATNCISGCLQSIHCDIVGIALVCNGFNLLVVSLAALVKVWRVAIFAHGPCTPLLMRDDHAPLIRCTGISVTIAIHNFWDWALPIVTCHFDQISFCSSVDVTIKDICEWHWSFAAASCVRISVPHRTSGTVVAFTATPHFWLLSFRQSPTTRSFQALSTSSSADSWSGHGPVLTGRCHRCSQQGKETWHQHGTTQNPLFRSGFWNNGIRTPEPETRTTKYHHVES